MATTLGTSSQAKSGGREYDMSQWQGTFGEMEVKSTLALFA